MIEMSRDGPSPVRMRSPMNASEPRARSMDNRIIGPTKTGRLDGDAQPQRKNAISRSSHNAVQQKVTYRETF
jgi:hypothetical protein